MKELQKNDRNRVFWWAVILCTLYLSYRYPLQINASGTSSTYSDTPVALQLGKFILACPLFAIAAVRCLRKPLTLRRWLACLGILFLAGYSLLKVVGDSDLKYIELAFWMLFPLVLVWGGNAIRRTAIERYLQFLLVCALGSTVIQVFIFIVFGRLPALAYEGTFLIRFGGFLDDPNGFGAILFLLMGWSYGRFKGSARFLIVGGIVVCLMLTQSWTALAFFLVVCVVWLLRMAWKRPWLVALLICGCLVLGMILVRNMPQSPATVFEAMMNAKQGSIEGHSFSWQSWFLRWPQWIMLGDAKYNPYESWWAGALVNFGVVWLVVFIGLMAKLLMVLRQELLRADSETRPIYLGFLLFGYYFVFGSLSLPFPTIFPVNFLFFLFCVLAVFGQIKPAGGDRVRSMAELSQLRSSAAVR